MSWLLRRSVASTQHSLRPESRLGAVYCTRVGIYWPGVVCTARAPGPHGVHPTLVQWRPVGRVGRRRVRTLCLAFGGSRYEPATYPTNARPLTQGRARRPGLSSSGVVRAERSPASRPAGVSDVMTSETLRSHETAQFFAETGRRRRVRRQPVSSLP